MPVTRGVRSVTPAQKRQKRDVDYVFYELTRSICPECRRVVDAHILLRNNKVYMRKRCPEHGEVEALVYGDAKAYMTASRFNKPGTIPLEFTTNLNRGCPHDCGLCPDHQQHACLGIIEVNSACNMDCPLCFANAGAGFTLTLAEVEGILDDFVRTEGHPEVVQFSGGEPSIHPQIIPMLRAAKDRTIRHVMLNTNGKRIAHDDRFIAELAEIRPSIYFQFDGFSERTYEIMRAEPGILPEKLRALDRLAEIGCPVILVPAIERGVNEHEGGAIVRSGLEVEHVEPHDSALGDLVEMVRQRLDAANLLIALGKLKLRGADLVQAQVLARRALEEVRDGRLGYAIVTAVRPLTPRDAVGTVGGAPGHEPSPPLPMKR